MELYQNQYPLCDECGRVHGPDQVDVDGIPVCQPTRNHRNSGAQQHRLVSVWKRMPNTAFGISMGLAGNAIMWKAALSVYSAYFVNVVGAVFWGLSCLSFMVISAAYAYKAWMYPHMIRDEWNNPGRIHFMNAPNLVLLMLATGVPSNVFGAFVPLFASNEQDILSFCWSVGFVVQLVITLFIYEKWLFSPTSNIVSAAVPQFLLSTVGWFLLATLGQQVEIAATWGLNFPAYCLGAGLVLYFITVIAIFNRLHLAPQTKGSPPLTLLIAPPSVGVVALDTFDGDPTRFGDSAAGLLGWCLLLFFILLKLGPRIAAKPPSLGAYWAYVFPLSALATATLRCSTATESGKGQGAWIFSAVFCSVATVAVSGVAIRMMVHMASVVAGNDQWGDPLLVMAKIQQQQEQEEQLQQSQLQQQILEETTDNDDEEANLPAAPEQRPPREKAKKSSRRRH